MSATLSYYNRSDRNENHDRFQQFTLHRSASLRYNKLIIPFKNDLLSKVVTDHLRSIVHMQYLCPEI